MKIFLVVCVVMLAGCQPQGKFSIIGEWKFETIAAPDSTGKFRMVYATSKVDSLARARAMESIRWSSDSVKNFDSELNMLTNNIAASLRRWDIVTMTFKEDSTVITNNYRSEFTNQLIQKWTLNNDQLKLYELDERSDTGLAFVFKALSKDRWSMTQLNPRANHEVLKYVMIRKQ